MSGKDSGCVCPVMRGSWLLAGCMCDGVCLCCGELLLERVSLSSGDQLMKKPMSCGTASCDLISMASLTLRWCQNWTRAMGLVSFQLMRWSCS